MTGTIKIQTGTPSRASFEDIIKTAINRFGKNSPQAKKLEKFLKWIKKYANQRVKNLVNSFDDPTTYRQAFNEAVEEACRSPQRATFEDIINAAIDKFGKKSPQARVLKRFLKWVNRTANKRVRNLINSLGDPVPYKKAYDAVVFEKCGYKKFYKPSITGVTLKAVDAEGNVGEEITDGKVQRGQAVEITISGKDFPTDSYVDFVDKTDLVDDAFPKVYRGDLDLYRQNTISFKTTIPEKAKIDNPDTKEIENMRGLCVNSKAYVSQQLYGCRNDVFRVVAAPKEEVKVACDVYPAEVIAGKPFIIKCSGDDSKKVKKIETDIPVRLSMKSWGDPIETDKIIVSKAGSYELKLLDKDGKLLKSFGLHVNEKPVTSSTSWWEDMISFLRDTLNLRGEMKMGIPLATARRSRLAALEDKLSSTVDVELKSNYHLLDPEGTLTMTFGPELSYKHNIRTNGVNDTYRVIPGVNTELHLKFPKYAQAFFGAGYQYTHQKERYPILFHPERDAHSYYIKTGIKSELGPLNLALSYRLDQKFFDDSYKFTFIDPQFENVMNEHGIKYSGEEMLHSVDLNFEVPLGEESSLRLATEIGIGQRHLPVRWRVGDTVLGSGKRAVDVLKWNVDAEAKFGMFSILAAVSQQTVGDYDPEIGVSAGVGLDTEKFGNFKLIYDYDKLNPNNPFDTHGVRTRWTLPWGLNLFIDAYGYGGDESGGGVNIGIPLDPPQE